jgi:guanine deaminase
MLKQIVRGPLLIPMRGGFVQYHADGALAGDERGMLVFVGDWKELSSKVGVDFPSPRRSDGVMLPPFLDVHTHIPQHPIRGGFLDGVPPDVKEGRLLAGLARNVFPAEIQCNSEELSRRVVGEFHSDTLAHGVVGGAAYMTISAPATRIALTDLPSMWSVGLVLMNQNCPENLRTDEANLDLDVESLAAEFGRRFIVTDRFAVAVDSTLRRRGAALAARFGLRTQTHLNEQTSEKDFVEKRLYPNYASYTDVYRRDGLLEQECIVAHCVHMRNEEWKMLADSGAAVAHCPTSNLALGSGVMSLANVSEYQIPFAIATDIGASPTVSMLAEMGRFIAVHRGLATHEQALYRATLAPAEILNLDKELGQLAPGRPMSFIEVAFDTAAVTAEKIIASMLPADLDHPRSAVRRVTLAGKVAFESRA